jgi:two-component system KDP operon response regulator KdpE
MAGTGSLRILIVDDEPAIIRFLRPSLETQGYVVSAAGDAATALDLVRRGAADLLVLDLGLPDMDGLDVVTQIRGTGATLPIIILSSRDEENAPSNSAYQRLLALTLRTAMRG